MISENGKRKARLQEPTAKTGQGHPHNNKWCLHKSHHSYKSLYAWFLDNQNVQSKQRYSKLLSNFLEVIWTVSICKMSCEIPAWILFLTRSWTIFSNVQFFLQCYTKIFRWCLHVLNLNKTKWQVYQLQSEKHSLRRKHCQTTKLVKLKRAQT